MHADIWFDGACYGNPGPTGGGAIVDIDGHRHIERVFLGHGTNNEAEYGGLIAGLRRANALGATSVRVRGDSQLVLRQLEGRYKVRAVHLVPLYQEAKRLLAAFERVSLEWIRRDQNAAADQAARDAIDKR